MSIKIAREQASQVIAELEQNRFFRRYWRAIGTFLGRRRQFSIWVSAALVMLANLALGVTVSALLGESQFTTPVMILTNFMWVAYTYFMIPISLGINGRLIKFLRTRLLYSLEDEREVHELQIWAEKWLSRMFLQISFFVGFALFIAPASFYGLYRTTHFSVGTVLLYGINFFHLAAGVYGLISLIAFLWKLNRWNLALYPDDPAGSLIMVQLSRELRDYILIYSFSVAMFMALSSLVGGLNMVNIFLFVVASWIPVLTLFILGNYVISQQVTRAKQQRLGELQTRIMGLSKIDSMDKETTTHVTALMDYYERVKSTRNSLHNTESLINLIGSLALPLFAAILSAIDVWQRFFSAP